MEMDDCFVNKVYFDVEEIKKIYYFFEPEIRLVVVTDYVVV